MPAARTVKPEAVGRARSPACGPVWWEDTPSAASHPCALCRHQVRKILDLVQSKGEEVSEFFLYVLQQLADAYVDLRPWLSEIGFSPSPLIQSKTVVNTDPGTVSPGGLQSPRKQGPGVWKCCSVRAQQHINMWSTVASPAFRLRQQAQVLCSFCKRRAGPCPPSAAQGPVNELTARTWYDVCRGPWKCGDGLGSDVLLTSCSDICRHFNGCTNSRLHFFSFLKSFQICF